MDGRSVGRSVGGREARGGSPIDSTTDHRIDDEKTRSDLLAVDAVLHSNDPRITPLSYLPIKPAVQAARQTYIHAYHQTEVGNAQITRSERRKHLLNDRKKNSFAAESFLYQPMFIIV